MIVCPTCGKENEDFFRFCLGCGFELDEVGDAGSSATGPSQGASDEAEEDASASGDEATSPFTGAMSAEPGGEPLPEEDEEPVTPPPEPPAELDEPVSDLGRAFAASADAAASAEAPAVDETPTDRDRGGGTAAAAEPQPAAPLEEGPQPAADGAAEATCRVCGMGMRAEDAFCGHCGAPSERPEAEDAREQAEPAAPRSGVAQGRLVVIEEDGSDGDVLPLDAEGTVIGSHGGHVNFPEDDFLAPRHVELLRRDEHLVVRPFETTNGVFVRLTARVRLASGDCFRVGQELLRFDRIEELLGSDDRDEGATRGLGSTLPSDVWGRLAQEIGPEELGNAYLLIGDEVRLGRERGDITFPEDGYVSAVHAALTRRGGEVQLADLDSSNGTFLRLREEMVLRPGDQLLVGQQLFRAEP